MEHKNLVLPVEISQNILLLLDKPTLIQITYVNKNWSAVVQTVLPRCLFEHYNTQIPHPIKEGYFLNSFCEALEQPTFDVAPFFSDYQLLFGVDIDPAQYLFLKANQKHFLQWFLNRFNIVVDGSETLLQFIARSSKVLQQTIDSRTNENDRLVSSQYIQTQLAHVESHINFIFSCTHIKRFLQLYDRKTYLVKGNLKSEDYYFLAQYLQKAERLESFLITLILFDKFKHLLSNESLEMMLDKNWSSPLAGDALIVLESTGRVLGLLDEIVRQWRNADNGTIKGQWETFLMKLRPQDLIVYIKISSYQVNNAVFANQPQIIVLLCEGSILSDSALVQFLLRTPDMGEFFDKIQNIPQLILRLTHPLFLNRFLKIEAKHDHKKACFAIAMLQREFFLSKLNVEDAFKLAKIALKHAYEPKVLKVFQYPALAQKFTSEQISILLNIKLLPCVQFAHDYTLRSLLQKAEIREGRAQQTLFSGKEDSTSEEQTELTRHIIQTRRMANTIRRQQAEQETRSIQFLKKTVSWFGISSLWLLISLALIIIGGVLGGLGIITAPVMTTLLTVGSLLLISLLIVSAIIKIHNILTKNDSLDSSDSSDNEDIRNWSFQTPNTPQPPRPMSYTPQQQNLAAYTHVLHQGTPQLLMESGANHYRPNSPSKLEGRTSENYQDKFEPT